MAKWLESVEKALGGGPSGPKRVRTLRVLLVIGCFGAILVLLNSFFNFKSVEPNSQLADTPPVAESVWGNEAKQVSALESIETSLEVRLKDILEKIVGVGSVDVLVTVDSTEEIIVVRDTQESQQITDENDKNGGKRHVTSISKDGQVVLHELSGDQQPIISKTINPKIRGVLIVAMGAENATVRNLIIDAVEKGVNVPVTRISVLPSKQ